MRGRHLRVVACRTRLLLCVSLAVSLLVGCATGGAVKRTQMDVRRVEQRVELLNQQVSDLDSLLLLRQSQSQREWSSLATDGGNVMSRLQQVQARMDEVSRRLADLRQEIELLRLYGLGQGASAGSPGPTGAAGAASSPRPQAAAAPSLVADPQSLYDQAMSDMKAGNHDLAAATFAQFVESFPGDSLADNALYWQGECAYAQRDFAGAATIFGRVLDAYADGDKVPAAMLKLGFSLVESKVSKERQKGIAQLKSLVQKHPDSPEAASARDRLRNLATQAAPPKRRAR